MSRQILSRCILSLAFASAFVPAGNAQTILTGGTVNSADYTRSFAPGAIISIFGTKLATSTAQATSLPLPPSLAGTSVTIAATGEVCPLYFVSAGQINAQLPYDVPLSQVGIKVTTAAGTSNTDTITVSAAAPKIFSLDFSGTGPAVATTTAFNVLTSLAPAKPSDTVVLWVNSLGATTGSPVAGQAAPGLAPGSQLSTTLATPTVTFNGLNAPVTFSGLTPGLAGLYQVNVQSPFVVLTGPVNVVITVGGVSSQATITIPFRQMGFYYSLLGGKAPAGQSLTAATGTNSSLAYEQSDAVSWGANGFNAWTNNTGLSAATYSAVPGMAFTMKNGTSIVFDNNGIETGTTGTFYNNAGGPDNSLKAGLTDLYSMSNYFPLLFSGYFTLSASTTITELDGYFDPNGNVNLPFDPSNPFIKYRMNIWSNLSSNLPKQTTNEYTGDIFSSDSVAGTFSYSDTGVKMVSSKTTDAPKPIFRLTYKLATPLTLPAGSYWFAHDASIRSAPAATSTANSITDTEFADYISRHSFEGQSYRFSFFGQEMLYRSAWTLPAPVQVRPSSPTRQ